MRIAGKIIITRLLSAAIFPLAAVLCWSTPMAYGEARMSLINEVDDRLVAQAADQLSQDYAPVNGGFGVAPKFPRPAAMRFLLRYAQRAGDGRIREMVIQSLRQIAAGGMYDQLGGGFRRYAVDAAWRLPHFEKILSDQAQWAVLFLEAAQLSHEPHFREVAAKTLDYTLRSWRDEGGWFASAEDVDSPLSEDRAQSGAAIAKLLAARDCRPHPHLDDKVLTSWNGLMLSALAKGALVLDQPRYLQAAQELAAFIRDRMVAHPAATLWHRFRAGEAEIDGLLDDYAFTVQGLLDLYQTSFEGQWLDLAWQLTGRQITLFEDGAQGGFFVTSGEESSVIARLKADCDGAELAGSSVAALNLFRLGAILGKGDLWAKGDKTVRAFGAQLHQSPGALPEMLAAYEFKRQKPRQIVLAGERGAVDTLALQRVVAEGFLPNSVVILAQEGPWPTSLIEPMARLRFMTRQGGKATAYLCENLSCQQPTTDPQVLRKMLFKTPTR